MSPSKPPERTDSRLARRVVDELWPDPPTRLAVATFVAGSIAYANSVSASSWSVTLFPGYIALNVGQIQVLDVGPESMTLYLEGPSGPSKPPGISFREAPNSYVDITAVHWSTVGDPRAEDSELMSWARVNQHVVFTHDLDFGAALALTQAESPSVIQVRTQDVTPAHLETAVVEVLKQNESLLEAGALIGCGRRKIQGEDSTFNTALIVLPSVNS